MQITQHRVASVPTKHNFIEALNPTIMINIVGEYAFTRADPGAAAAFSIDEKTHLALIDIDEIETITAQINHDWVCAVTAGKRDADLRRCAGRVGGAEPCSFS